MTPESRAPRIAAPWTRTTRGPVLALDLGGTNARAAVITPAGRLSTRRAGPTPMADGAAAVVTFCSSLLREALDEHLSAGGAPPLAVGICAPGPLDARAGTLIDPPNLRDEWWGFPLAPVVAEPFGLPWALEKDTNVALLGEAHFGAGRGSRDLVYLTISTGIGGAACSDGRPVVGPDGVAGELGHVTVDMDGPQCGCGGPGHLEALASGTGIARAARDALERGADAPVLVALAARLGGQPLTAVHVAEAEAAGDPVAMAILERARRAVAVAAVSFVNVFGPDAVILGGGITLAWGERLLGPAREAVAAKAFRIQAARARVVVAALGDDVGLIGTVPLVASALPGLAESEDNQPAAGASAPGAVT
jgi:glucokinase